MSWGAAAVRAARVASRHAARAIVRTEGLLIGFSLFVRRRADQAVADVDAVVLDPPRLALALARGVAQAGDAGRGAQVDHQVVRVPRLALRAPGRLPEVRHLPVDRIAG